MAKGDFTYANGLTIAIARKLCKFYFGDFFFKAEKNEKQLRFDIYLKNRVKGENGEVLQIEDFADIDYFNQFWNEGNLGKPVLNVLVVSVNF
jgi:hypothetical protein